MKETTRAFLTGAARGAITGAAIGMALLGVATVLAGSYVIGFGAILQMATAFVVGALGGGSMLGLGFGAIVGGISLIGALYKGMSDFADMSESLNQKQEMVGLAKAANDSLKVSNNNPVLERPFVPERNVEYVTKQEVPREWVKTEDMRRAVAKDDKEQTR